MIFPSIPKAIKALFRFLERPVAAPHNVAAVRNARCQLCPRLQDGQCLECTCAVSIKVLMATESCPLKKWGEYHTPKRDGL